MGLRKCFSLDSIYISMKKMRPYRDSACPRLKRALYKKPPLEICFLSTIWVPIEVKMKMSLEEVTQVISESCVLAGFSKSHIKWINCNKVRFYFYYMNCNSWENVIGKCPNYLQSFFICYLCSFIQHIFCCPGFWPLLQSTHSPVYLSIRPSIVQKWPTFLGIIFSLVDS